MSASVEAGTSQPVPAPPATEGPEQRFVVHGVSWNDYAALNDALGVPGLRMWFCEGALELMTTSKLHERLKTTIARLVELFAFETGLRLNGYGSATFRARAKERGAEPDECYVVDRVIDEFPDLVIEVVLTTGGIDKLEVYEGMGIREVWFYENEAFHLHELGEAGYRPIERSRLVPGLDFDALAHFTQLEDQHEALTALRDWLRQRDA